MKKTQITIWTKWIAVIEVTIAVILLTREVYQLLTLRSVYAPDDGLIIEFEKYKEDTYAPMFMWYILFLAGIMSLRKNIPNKCTFRQPKTVYNSNFISEMKSQNLKNCQ